MNDSMTIKRHLKMIFTVSVMLIFTILIPCISSFGNRQTDKIVFDMQTQLYAQNTHQKKKNIVICLTFFSETICDDEPCTNNGTCFLNASKHLYSCSCERGKCFLSYIPHCVYITIQSIFLS